MAKKPHDADLFRIDGDKVLGFYEDEDGQLYEEVTPGSPEDPFTVLNWPDSDDYLLFRLQECLAAVIGDDKDAAKELLHKAIRLVWRRVRKQEPASCELQE